ncbi:MAG: SDR family oxidoreductase [Ruminococcaceae bacterium]|nr:SDR family oxidoreductase [Oscillospiraceae bacterium]
MKKVLISGGSRGIGAACVTAFCRAGFDVAFIYNTSDECARVIEAATGAHAIKADISLPEQAARAIDEAEKLLGGIDVLVNNAGVSHIGLFTEMTNGDWRRIIDTNLSGAFYLCRGAAGGMIRRKWGRIINIGSMWGKVGASCEVAYSASKAGLRGLTQAMAKELAPSGITVNCIEPGVIDTQMNAALPKDVKRALAEETPVGRFGTSDEVAAAVLFFASDSASFITGQCLGVDGGMAI